MTAKRIQSIETSAELPVENLYNHALTNLIDVHAQLSALPADKNDPLEPLDVMLRGLGVDMGTDYSMFMMGAMSNVGLEMGMHAMGLSAGAGAMMTLDAVGAMAMESSEDKLQKQQAPAIKYGVASKSVFAAKPSFRRAGESAPKKPAAPLGATSMMKNALTRPGLSADKHTANKRKNLRKDMEIYKDNIRELAAFKSCGVKYARRVTVPVGDTGEVETYLVASLDKPHAALTARGKPIDVSLCQKPGAPAPSLGMAA